MKKTINESQLKQIVSESVKRVLLERNGYGSTFDDNRAMVEAYHRMIMQAQLLSKKLKSFISRFETEYDNGGTFKGVSSDTIQAQLISKGKIFDDILDQYIEKYDFYYDDLPVRDKHQTRDSYGTYW